MSSAPEPPPRKTRPPHSGRPAPAPPANVKPWRPPPDATKLQFAKDRKESIELIEEYKLSVNKIIDPLDDELTKIKTELELLAKKNKSHIYNLTDNDFKAYIKGRKTIISIELTDSINKLGNQFENIRRIYYLKK
jgi:hypothetical protein